ncbi:T-cell receptor alpha chain V region 2B4 [Microtus ochrogaster]|nr:T-cell receptor alpha chain V region 2B4 [Microtus ochrogaster]
MKRLLCSLLGLLCTQVCWVKGQQVKQSPVSLVLQEGESTELHCNFSTMGTQMQWFYQSPGGHIISLFYNPSGTKKSGRLKSTTVTQEPRSSLYISSSQSTDSGTYFCAVDPQCSHTPAASTQSFSWVGVANPSHKIEFHYRTSA